MVWVNPPLLASGDNSGSTCVPGQLFPDGQLTLLPRSVTLLQLLIDEPSRMEFPTEMLPPFPGWLPMVLPNWSEPKFWLLKKVLLFTVMAPVRASMAPT
ncbi:MAG TPA: hypothetical protein VMJ64_02480, partial [Anaerolineales bacterium]|nr:hypothetical protein [Anaerolineales bacterium]